MDGIAALLFTARQARGRVHPSRRQALRMSIDLPLVLGPCLDWRDPQRRRIEMFDKAPDALRLYAVPFRGAGILVAPAMARMYAAK